MNQYNAWTDREVNIMNRWIDKVAGKIGRLAIPNLMKYIVVCMAAVFAMDLVFDGMLSGYLLFDKAAIFRGEIWRVVSFIFLPASYSLLFIVFVLYFYWMIGVALEREWGVAKFNLFYWTGILGTLIAGLITGFATNDYLNMTLFLAFAILYPEFEIRLFFVLPVKIKWLAYLDAAILLWMLIMNSWPGRVALLVSLANLALFFGQDAIMQIGNLRRRRQWRKHFR
jgi:hypothetical protein